MDEKEVEKINKDLDNKVINRKIDRIRSFERKGGKRMIKIGRKIG